MLLPPCRGTGKDRGERAEAEEADEADETAGAHQPGRALLLTLLWAQLCLRNEN